MYRKNNLNYYLRIAAIILIVVLAVSLVAARVDKDKDDYNKVRVGWTIGGLDENHQIDHDNKYSLVSDRIEAGKGFKVEPDFNKGVTYSVFFYDKNDIYLDQLTINEQTEFTNICEVSSDEIEAMFADEFAAAKENSKDFTVYFRIVLRPDDKYGELNFIEKLTVATHIEIGERK